MKMRNIYIQILFLTFVALLSSCEDFLDKSPDSRAEIDSPEQLTKLLVNGYTSQNYALIGELSSDNFVDNNSPDKNGVYYNLSAFERLHDEIFAWEPGVSSQDNDSPSSVWSGCYHAIAVANQALEAIARFEAEGRGNEVKAQKGEALLIRAYHHFILVNIFCEAYKDDILSKNDSGVPYITAPENTVLVKYNRSNVADTYNKIEKDLLEGLNLIDNTSYKVPKYHFNTQAALAFATRFYLYKRDYIKVVQMSTLVLGFNPETLMRNWNADFPTYTAFADGWINVQSPNNFMLLSTYSTFNRIFGTRYGCNRDAADGTIFGTGPTWQGYNFHPCFNGQLYLRGDVEYGVFFPKAGEYFEYTDKIAGIGYAHIVRAEFTAEETLLCRAEAFAYLGFEDFAIDDLKTYDDSRKVGNFKYTELTDSLIRSFYKPSNTLFVKTFNTEKLSPHFVVPADIKPIIDCVLHFRRIETIYDGLRWFDIKRYGIEIEHAIGKTEVKTLKWNDLRRAIQIPDEVISAGLSPNKRTSATSGSSNVKLTIKP